MNSFRQLDDANCWRVSGVRNGETFFRAIEGLIPDATHLFLEGSPSADINLLVEPYIEPAEFMAPAGTWWSWPKKNQRLILRASPQLFDGLSKAAAQHAEPEICSHLHIYRGAEPLLNWFDAFDDPILVSKTIPRDRVEQFCREVGGALCDPLPDSARG